MRRRTLAAAAALASVLSLAVPLSTASATADRVARYRAQQVGWQSCGAQVPAELECATITVPRDWHRPGAGQDLSVAISRLKAGKPAARHGVMLLNPGGPGASGLFMPLSIKRGAPKVAEAYDLIGFDPRGVGRSTRIQCQTAEEYAAFLAIDVRDRSRDNIRAMLDTSRDIAVKCRKRSGELLRYINTDQTVRDMDLIRQVLGEPKISYLGYSAGTWLGSHYATTFPRRVDRFVLDSSVQFTTSWYNSFNWQPLGFERRFTDFMAWLARYDSVYHYGTTAKAARARWEARRAALQRKPLEVSDTFTLRPGNLDSGVAGVMYVAAAFPDLAAALAALEHFDAATPAEKELIEAVFGSFFDASLYAVFFAVTCNDTLWPRDPGHYVRLSDRLGRRYPLLGYSWIEQPCAFWPYRAPEPQRVDGAGLPTVLMINSTHDPATPYEGAQLAHRAFRNSRFVTVRNDGDHGQFASGNACVDEIGTRFFVDGVAPRRDTTCEGLPLPGPQSAQQAVAPATRAAEALSAGRHRNVLDETRELTRRYGG